MLWSGMSVYNLRLARYRSGLRLSTSLKTATADATILFIAIKSIKCLGQNQKTQIDRQSHGCTLTQVMCTFTHLSDSDATW